MTSTAVGKKEKKQATTTNHTVPKQSFQKMTNTGLSIARLVQHRFPLSGCFLSHGRSGRRHGHERRRNTMLNIAVSSSSYPPSNASCGCHHKNMPLFHESIHPGSDPLQHKAQNMCQGHQGDTHQASPEHDRQSRRPGNVQDLKCERNLFGRQCDGRGHPHFLMMLGLQSLEGGEFALLPHEFLVTTETLLFHNFQTPFQFGQILGQGCFVL